MEIQDVQSVKLILGIIYHPDIDIRQVLRSLETVFGEPDMQSAVFPFDMTDYYEAEMGDKLLRIFVSYRHLISPIAIAEIKCLCNLIERNLSKHHKRSVNLDPGYMDLDKFVLASAKYGRQKIYIGHGIYADPTLYYFKKAFHAYEWSFPDFKSGRYDTYLIEVRQHYKKQLRS
jgi:hypothetical protein